MIADQSDISSPVLMDQFFLRYLVEYMDKDQDTSRLELSRYMDWKFWLASVEPGKLSAILDFEVKPHDVF